MPDKLPEGWAKTILAEVCARVATIQPEDSPDTEFTYFDIGGIDNQSNRIVETKTVIGRDAPSRARQAVRKDDILFSTVRTYLKKIARIDQDYPNAVASTGFTVIRAAEGVSPQFLFSQVLSEDFLQPLHALQTGSSYPAVRDKDVFAQPIRLAPSREQERIVAKLDALLSRVAAGEAAARRALARLQRYRAAVLHAAVTGELTRKWRKTHKPEETGAQLLKRLLGERRAHWEEAELKRLHAAGSSPKGDKWKKRYAAPPELNATNLPSLPRGWTWAGLQQLGFIVGGLTKNPRRASLRTKLPYLRVGNVYANELRLDEVKTIGVEKEELDKLLLEKGDLLIVEGNGSKDQIGRLAIWDGSIEKCVHQNHIIKVRLVEKALGTWILSWLLSPPGRHHVEKVASSTTGLYTLSVGKVANLPIPLPPSTEQAEIGRQVDPRMTAADRLTTTLSRQLQRAQLTRQSLLRKAFAGNLVPQDPNDEPAPVLLERIRVAREAEANKPKAKRMPKSKSKVVRRPLLDVLRSHKKPISPEQLFRESGFQQEFEESEYRHEIVDEFYEQLRTLTGPRGPVTERRPNSKIVRLEVKS